jgi:hypothetical protein
MRKSGKIRTIGIVFVLLAYLCLLVFGVFLVLGVFNWKNFIVAGAALLAYFIVNAVFLRCPCCRSSINLNMLLRGKRHSCYCPACGHEIIVTFKSEEI